MKFFVVVLALCCVGLSARGQFIANVGTSETTQATSSPLVINDVQRVKYKIAYPPGYKMRNTGRLLTLIGAPLFVAGIVVYSNADQNYYNTVTTSSGTYTEGDPQAAAGVLMIVTGAGLTVPGVIFWSKGAKKYKRHMEKQAAFKFDNKGLSLSYRF